VCPDAREGDSRRGGHDNRAANRHPPKEGWPHRGLHPRFLSSHCVIVCDEIQILGDEYRGRDIEVLLTLLRKSRWGQLIGLSAVIDTRDARDLKDWFGVTLVRLERREKHLLIREEP